MSTSEDRSTSGDQRIIYKLNIWANLSKDILRDSRLEWSLEKVARPSEKSRFK